ncbi:LysR family transcriptional regulator [Amycolatopsis australiensis]|uniref:DNA-binding transcriptional regulator, LysR family n=1 Tax=Amycolatopsis australiensis TaxID=546364 RepID=A0A1K1SKN6_9PSEU|nr:LysR family transcriptional regulator [Amycolatopsis australiensis]SFW84405.1 DNA-binding transcriptional regulator, LysR family [Amycolatopsis australiensis]
MLDLRRLRVLHALAQHRTVAATAAALHLTGPAVSQHLAALEREAGVPLLEKHGRTLEFTAAGRLLVSHAEVVLDDLAAAESALAAVAENGTGTVRVAAFASAARQLLPRVWDGPVSLRLVEQEPDAALASLRRRDVDIAVVHSYSLLPRDIPPRCEERMLVEEPVLLATARPVEEPVRLADFADDPWLVPASDLSCHEMIRRACGAAGFVPSVVAESADFAVLVALAAAGAGVALVPSMAVPAGAHGAGLHRLEERVTRKVFAVTRSGLTRRPDVRLVLDRLERSAREWAS